MDPGRLTGSTIGLASVVATVGVQALPLPRSRPGGRGLAALLGRRAPQNVAAAAEPAPPLLLVVAARQEGGGIAVPGQPFDVRRANTGSEALRVVAGRLPVAVLVHADAGDMSGYELTRRLRESERTAGVPVVLLEPSAQARASAYAIAFGARACLAPDAGPAEILAALEPLLGPGL